MKKVGLFVLALIAIVIADDKRLEEVAKRFETDGETIQACLQEVEADSEEISILIEKWDEAQDDAISDDAKQSLIKYSNFLGCILQKKGMVIICDNYYTHPPNKLIESVEKDNDLPKPSNKEGLTKCLNLLNEDNKMTRDDRVFGLMLCVINNQMDEEGGSKYISRSLHQGTIISSRDTECIESVLLVKKKIMRFFALSVCLMATAIVVYADTIADIALHGGVLSTADLQECYNNANLAETNLITNAEIKDGSYKNPENQEKARKNGCFTLCILRKRGQAIKKFKSTWVQIATVSSHDGDVVMRAIISSFTVERAQRCLDNGGHFEL
ncbi:hypothetical protein DBV15_11913 [Temnothorax longispinosus]|uniref:Pheromone-binding protein Gp-9 n=1 Tax=Temnothorax longispinosus TaxID=300112 RepID=A0A4S2KJA1_9HYME|nr:hypothetical protein DBV15_11913 [Temnothorax longispinosus]